MPQAGLNTMGFELRTNPTKVKNFRVDDEVKAVY